MSASVAMRTVVSSQSASWWNQSRTSSLRYGGNISRQALKSFASKPPKTYSPMKALPFLRDRLSSLSVLGVS